MTLHSRLFLFSRDYVDLDLHDEEVHLEVVRARSPDLVVLWKWESLATLGAVNCILSIRDSEGHLCT